MSTGEVKARYYTLASISTMLAWGLEYYDIIVFSTLSQILEGVFKLSLVTVWFAFAITYFARPLGALIFGYLGDRFGRRTTAAIDAALMGAASLAIGLLPTYAQIGIAAPIALYVIRLIQGIGLGGEAGGGATWALEQVNPRWKPILNGVMYSGLSWAVFLAGAISILVEGSIGYTAFVASGWRILFYIGAVLALVALVIRVFGIESPEWLKARESGSLRKVPLANRRVWGINMLILILINLGLTIYYYGGLGYWPYVLPRLIAPSLGVSAKVADTYAYWLVVYGGIGAVIGEVLSGLVVLKTGVRGSFLYPAILLALTAPPAVYLAFKLSPSAYYASLITGVLFGLAAAPQTMYFTSLFPVESRWSAVSLGWNINAAVGPFGSLALALLVKATVGSPFSYMTGSLIMMIGAVLVIAGSLIKPSNIYAKPGEYYIHK
ncbi:MAG: MFS transporter [Caldivirga sp.]|uniref:MFS transporter n=1 Tax=Caldivirga sp. TaxID=2080243 RepID=UPI003D0D9AC2